MTAIRRNTTFFCLAGALLIACCLTLPSLSRQQAIPEYLLPAARLLSWPFIWLLGKASFILPLSLVMAGLVCTGISSAPIRRRWMFRAVSLPFFAACAMTGYSLLSGRQPNGGGMAGSIYYQYWQIVAGQGLGLWAGLVLLAVLFSAAWNIVSRQTTRRIILFLAGVVHHLVDLGIRHIPRLLETGMDVAGMARQSMKPRLSALRRRRGRPEKETVQAADVNRAEKITRIRQPGQSGDDSVRSRFHRVSVRVPLPDAPVPLTVLPEPPAQSQRRDELTHALVDLQDRIIQVVRRVARLDIIPAAEPELCLNTMIFTFRKNNLARESVSRINRSIPDIGLQTGRAPVTITIRDTIRVTLPLHQDERDFVPVKPLFIDAGPGGEHQEPAWIMGRKADGAVMELPVRDAKHMLVAGSTGSGKTCFLHNLIFSLIFRYSPREVRLALVDFKCFEFSQYRGLGHLWHDVVTGEEEFHVLLDRLSRELDRRKKQKIRDSNAKLPLLITIIDEFRGYNTDTLISLVAEARALDMYFILATQHPTADVISTAIKANLVTNVAFRARSAQASQLIIGYSDGVHLLGRGDCYIHSESAGLQRIQSGWVRNGREGDLEALTAWLRQNKNSGTEG